MIGGKSGGIDGGGGTLASYIGVVRRDDVALLGGGADVQDLGCRASSVSMVAVDWSAGEWVIGRSVLGLAQSPYFCVRIDDAGASELIQLLARTLVPECRNRRLETRQVRVAAFGPHILECNVPDPGLGSAGSRRGTGGRTLKGVPLAVIVWVETRVFALVLGAQLRLREEILVRAMIDGSRRIGDVIWSCESESRRWISRQTAHAEGCALGSGCK
eukprot:3102216-Pleurochrysis_carterae.AAC.1